MLDHERIPQSSVKFNHLPDLPNAGYSTRAERAVSDVIMFLIRGYERDRLLLLETVMQGKFLWRKRFKAGYRFLKADDEAADAIFGYFVILAGQNPAAQKARLLQMYEQQAQQAWDYRKSTAALFAKARRDLKMDIAKDESKPRKVYSR